MLRTIITSVVLFFVTQSIADGRINLFLRKPNFIFYNILAIFNLYSFFNMLFWNYEINFLIVLVITYILSLTMYFVHEFRGTNFCFADLSTIGTAGAVVGGYKIPMNPIALIFFIFIAMVIFFSFSILNINLFHNYHEEINGINSFNIDLYRFFWHEVGQLLCFFVSFAVIRDKVSSSDFDYSIYAGINEGYYYNFISSIPMFHKRKIKYEDAYVASKFLIFDTIRKLKKNNSKKQSLEINDFFSKLSGAPIKKTNAPHVIVIMNESFGTINRYINTDSKITPFYNSITGVIKGNLYVNAFGGGTDNTEFEFLTSMSIGNYDYPVHPYNKFIKTPKYSLARYFANMGYRTISMHPNRPSNYNRNNVYKNFGFEERVFKKGFKTPELIRGIISDESMYKEVIRRFRSTKANNNKLFLFGVTMQNHGGYGRFKDASVISTLKDGTNAYSVDTYLTLLKRSDNSLKKLINYFEGEDERVILVFFGDHNPSFGTNINKRIYDNHKEYEFTNTYKVPFLIYDNKKKEDRFIEAISPNFLSLELLKKGNFPYDMLHNILNNLYVKYPSFNFHKMKVGNTLVFKDIDAKEYLILEREYLTS